MDGPVLDHPGLLRVWPMHTAGESTLSHGEPWKSGLPHSPFHELAAPERSRLKPTRHLIVMTKRLRGVTHAASASQAAGAFARLQSPIGQEAPSSREWSQTEPQGPFLIPCSGAAGHLWGGQEELPSFLVGSS